MTEATGIQKASVFVERIKIRNFRGIQKLDLRLQPGLTLLVGRNNAGKSRILRALHVAMGGTRAVRDDLTAHPYSDTGSHWPEPLRELVDKLCRQLNDGNKEV